MVVGGAGLEGEDDFESLVFDGSQFDTVVTSGLDVARPLGHGDGGIVSDQVLTGFVGFLVGDFGFFDRGPKTAEQGMVLDVRKHVFRLLLDGFWR